MCQIDEYANEMAIPMFQLYSRLLIVSLAVLIQWISTMVRADTSDHTVTLRVRLSITTPLSYSNTPLDPVIDFPCLIQEAQTAGVLDPNSIVVINVATDEPIHRAITEDFAYSDRGRLEFVVADPRHTEFEIRSIRWGCMISLATDVRILWEAGTTFTGPVRQLEVLSFIRPQRSRIRFVSATCSD